MGVIGNDKNTREDAVMVVFVIVITFRCICHLAHEQIKHEKCAMQLVQRQQVVLMNQPYRAAPAYKYSNCALAASLTGTVQGDMWLN